MAKFIENSHPETSAIKERQSKLDTACERVKESAEKRLRKLKVCILTSGHIVYYYNYCLWKESQALCEFMLQVEEEEAWIKEKEALCSSMDFGKDLNTVMLSQQKHKVLEEDIEGREPHFKSLCEKGITVIQLELDKCLFLFNAWKPKVLYVELNYAPSWLMIILKDWNWKWPTFWWDLQPVLVHLKRQQPHVSSS